MGAEGVARGYSAAPKLTAASFSGEYPHRWYRTGDRGRYRPDGILEFLGRRDGQIKLHSHRIELSEIEQQLQACSGIQRALVMLYGSGASTSLHAFCAEQAECCLRSVLSAWAGASVSMLAKIQLRGVMASSMRWLSLVARHGTCCLITPRPSFWNGMYTVMGVIAGTHYCWR
ncbi:MAG: AMP-binding protein [Serratia symbiotica]|nr:AMP-binding protein [Serratia symbiotica]